MDDCAWVTQALQEKNVDKALVLGKSLRRVLTRKNLVVIIRSTISMPLRVALHATFDFVLSLDEEKYKFFEGLKMTPDTMAKVFAMEFTFFKHCVYLPPNCLVLKNCDEIFVDDFLKQARYQVGKNKAKAAYRFKPSTETFKNLSKLMIGKENVISSWNLDEWILNNNVDSVVFLEEPYYNLVELWGQHLLRNDDNLAILHLVDLCVDMENANFEKDEYSGTTGLLTKYIYDYWMDIYKNDVKDSAWIGINDNINEISTKIQTNISSREPVAIVGMSCRYPSSNNLAEFWNLLIEGGDGIQTPPDHRWTKEQSIYHNPETRNTQAGFLSVPVDEFDAKFFEISPKEMIFIDPQHRILHELVWEALEDAAINPLELKGSKSGVFMGTWRNDYYDILKQSPRKEFYRGYMGNSIGAGAARISHFLGLTGPSIATESGCSAAMVAAHMAVRSLQNGESSMALACGVNLLLHPFITDIMPMITSLDGHCKTFDASADGFGRAEGCGVLVLKRLSDAVRNGDSIWGVIKGTAITQEGMSKSMGTPTANCESEAMRSALRDAGIHPSQVSYVECHGTGTIVGDPLEVAAIGKVYSEGRKEPLVIGSVKTNVGHTESCSGITGIMKVILSMKHELIPPHKNVKQLNPEINLETIPAKLPFTSVNWPKILDKPRTAGVSSFGITGTDGHIILQEPLSYSNQSVICEGFERPLHLMTISAKTDDALEVLLSKYERILSGQNSKSDQFRNIAYTTNLGRAHFKYRAAIIAKDESDAAAILKSSKYLKDEMVNDKLSGKICFLFTGQGSQYHGMAKELHATSPVFQMYFDQCEQILSKKHNISIALALWETDETLINRTLYSQTGIFVVSYCLMKLWESWEVRPDCVLGHSLGEFCAAVCAGILTLEEALTLVTERSRLIDALPEGKMLVINADKCTVDKLQNTYQETLVDTEFWLDYAAVNSSDQTVVAGDPENVIKFSEWLKTRDVKCLVLQSSHAFHSRRMDPMLEKYRAIVTEVFRRKSISKLSCTYVSGLLGDVLDVESNPIDWTEYWVRHCRDMVSYLTASKCAYNEVGCRLFLEMGPHPVLATFTMMNNNQKQMMCLPSLRKNENDWKTMLTTVAKLYITGSVEIDLKRFHQFYERKKVGQLLPTYHFQGAKYWPNISRSIDVQIHPLLGSNIPNATSTKIFQNNLSLQDVKYLRDHVIGSTIVFPGAGYMETLLMAGYVTLEGGLTEFRYPQRPIQLENFRIEGPLGLEESIACPCQIVVDCASSSDSDSAGGLHARFHHETTDKQREISSRWIPHASANFTPYNSSDEVASCKDPIVYLDTMNRLKTSGHETLSNEFYNHVADVGLKFGPAFRTISRVWRGTDNNREFLAEVQIPEDVGHYLLHPTLIDAMIQTSVFHRENNQKINKAKLRVPISCERFVWFRPLIQKINSDTLETTKSATNDVCYIYSKGISRTVVLLDKVGRHVASLVNVETIETNVRTIQALLESQTKPICDMYKFNWKATLGPSERRLNFQMIEDAVDAVGNLQDVQLSYSETQERRDIDELGFHYIIIAFLKLEWKPQLNDVIELEEFVKQLEIKQQHGKLIRAFLCYLEEKNILIGSDDSSGKRQWTVQQLPESLEDYKSYGKTLASKLILSDAVCEKTLLLRDVGNNLDKVFTGTESALKLLFPEDESKPSAAKYYDIDFRRCKDKFAEGWNRIWESCRVTYEKEKISLPVIRILEVGAGTGAFTESIVTSLEDQGMSYEYHYTDLSAVFFPGAEKRFQKHVKNFKFRKLNLEEDPTSQGFAPKYYDFILGGLVVHATRDIKESLLNIRMLLKDGGNLCLVEQNGNRKSDDCIFGLLDGFWRFTDFELRPHHANMTVDKWMEIGRVVGFNKAAYIGMLECVFVAYKADNGVTFYYDHFSIALNSKMKQMQEESRKAWIIFHGAEEEEFVLRLKERFVNIGRKTVILVKLNSLKQQDLKLDEQGPLRSHYNIRADASEDIQSLFNVLWNHTTMGIQRKYSSIEGTLVTFGLCGENRDQSQITKPFLALMQAILKTDKKTYPQIVILTAGQHAVGDVICNNPSGSTLLGMAKSITNEHTELRIRGIDIDPNELEYKDEEIFQEIFANFNDEFVPFSAMRKGERLFPKLFPKTPQMTQIDLPSGTNRFQLIHPQSKSIGDLEFGNLELFTLSPNEIEIKVKCSALNFKDILNILKPTDEFAESNGVGFDFAGVVTAVGAEVILRKVGDPVYGINMMGNALPSHIRLKEEDVALMPDACSFAEAACFPTVFSTAYHCLVNIAQVRRGETVLIHTASGGVGLLTTQLAKHFGLNIICTAGSQRKRAYLRFLGIRHVFSSRNTDYGKEIMKVTSGNGIDVVLNSLTGPGFKKATLDACGKGARFIEMSKLSIWTEEEVAEMRPDVQYTVVDLTKLDKDTGRKLLNVSQELLGNGVLKAIPYTRFDAQNICAALTYLQKAQHIGKVVVTMPELKSEQPALNQCTLRFSTIEARTL